jgi:hypothetical protein
MHKFETHRLQSVQTLTNSNLPVFLVHGVVNGKCTCRGLNCKAAGKHPLQNGWKNEATLDFENISKAFNQQPNSNFGVRTGNGLIVLDVDPRHHGDKSLRDLISEYGNLPPTVTVLTGSNGGYHYYFRTSHPIPIGNKTNLRPGLDIRGDGGFLVAPGSRHLSGREYVFEVNSNPENGAVIAEIPTWLLQMILVQEKIKRQPVDMAKLIETSLNEGQRDVNLTTIAGHLLRRYVDPHLVHLILQSLNQTHCSPSIDRSQVTKIVESISKRELLRRKEASYDRPDPIY